MSKKEATPTEDKKGAKAKPKKVSIVKSRRKSWFRIIAPSVFGHREVGESYLGQAEEALGRNLRVNLKELTGNVKDQNAYIILKINQINGQALNTVVIGYELTAAYVRRAVRKNTKRLDDYFLLKTKGGKTVVIKTLMITMSKAQRSVCSQLRKETLTVLREELSHQSFDEFVDSLVHFKIQSNLKKRLKKIFPLKEIAVRTLALKEKGAHTEEVIAEDRSLVVEPVQETALVAEEAPAETAEDLTDAEEQPSN